MSIRSNLTPSPSANPPATVPVREPAEVEPGYVADVLRIAGMVLAASALAIIAHPSRMPSLADILVRVIVVIVAIVCMSSAVSVLERRPFAGMWASCLRLMPAAAIISVAASWINLWPEGSGALALSSWQAILFIVSGGLFPMSVGPEGITRILVLTLVCLFIWRGGESAQWSARLRTGVVAWLAGAAVLLVPTWVGFVLAALHGQSIANVEDAIRVYGTSLIETHWSTFQAERFFVNIGNQLSSTITLFTASVTFLVGVCVLALRSRASATRDVIRDLVRFPESPWLFAGVIVGCTAAVGPRGLSALGSVAVVLLAVAVVTLFSWLTDRRPRPSADRVADIRLLIALTSAFLLGWPILALVVSLIVIDRFVLRAWPFAEKQAYAEPIRIGILVSASVLLGEVFGFRHILFPAPMLAWAAPWGIVAASAFALPSALSDPQNRRRAQIVAGIGMIGCATALLFPVGLAIAALAELGVIWLTGRGEGSRKALPWILFGFAVLTSILKLFVAS